MSTTTETRSDFIEGLDHDKIVIHWDGDRSNPWIFPVTEAGLALLMLDDDLHLDYDKGAAHAHFRCDVDGLPASLVARSDALAVIDRVLRRYHDVLTINPDSLWQARFQTWSLVRKHV